MATTGTQIAEQLGLDPNAQITDNLGIEQRLKTMQGKKPSIPTIDSSQIGTANTLQMPTDSQSKSTNALAKVSATPESSQTAVPSYDDFINNTLQNVPQEQRDVYSQFLSKDLFGGVMGQTYKDIVEKTLSAQVNQAQRKKDTARLQEQAGLPELSAQFAETQGKYDLLEASKNSRLINETQGTLSKRTLNNRVSEIQRQYGLQVADNRIDELATAGKINAATQLIDAKLDLKYGDIEAELDLYKQQLETITPFLNAEQSKIAEERNFALTQITNEINNARQSEKELGIAKAQAVKNAVDRGASPQQIAQIQDAASLGELAATGFTTSAMEQAELRAQIIANEIDGQKLTGGVGVGSGTTGAVATLLGVSPERIVETPDGQSAFIFKDAEPEKADKELVNQMFSAIGVVDRLEEQYKKAVGSEYQGIGSGVLSRIKGVGRFIGSALGTNQELEAYENLRGANLSIISRGLKGEKGTLSDGDIKRAKKSLPGKFSSPLEAQRAFDDLRAQVADNISLRGEVKTINDILLENLSPEQEAELRAEGLID